LRKPHHFLCPKHDQLPNTTPITTSAPSHNTAQHYTTLHYTANTALYLISGVNPLPPVSAHETKKSPLYRLQRDTGHGTRGANRLGNRPRTPSSLSSQTDTVLTATTPEVTRSAGYTDFRPDTQSEARPLDTHSARSPQTGANLKIDLEL
jgi:hypothetical protein